VEASTQLVLPVQIVFSGNDMIKC